jgi:hypothetical protein
LYLLDPSNDPEFFWQVISGPPCISGSAKRSSILQEIQEFLNVEKTKILNFAATRRLSRHACIVRILNHWGDLTQYFQLAVFEDKLKTAENILSELQNIYTKAYLLFLKYALNFINTFNALFQSKTILIHVLHEQSQILLKDLCSNFIKPEIWMQTNLHEIDVFINNHHLPLNKIKLGIECEAIVEHQMTTDGRNEFIRNCLNFYITATREMQERLPLNNDFFKNLIFLNPAVAFSVEKREQHTVEMKHVATKFANYIDLTNLSVEWSKLPHVFSELDINNFKSMKVDQMWLKIAETKNFNEEDLFPNLGKLASLVLTLPHSNAEAERIFSVVTDIKTKKRNRIGSGTLNSMCVVRSSLQNKEVDCTTFKITRQHLDLHKKTMYSFK